LTTRRAAITGGGLVAATALGWTLARGVEAAGAAPALGAAIGSAVGVGAGFALARTLQGLPEAAPRQRISAEAAEQTRIARDRAHDASRALRGRRYRRPCYLLLGPSGVGKTTLLAHSGLNFERPDARQRREPEALRGPSWWIGRDATFVDVPGAWATQEFEPESDAAGWRALLRGVARTRPSDPVDGILLALSPADLALADAIERRELARALRARLDEVARRVRARPPVYVLLTKLDLVPGFVEFFDRSDEDELDQPWGFALPAEEPDDLSPVHFVASSFDELLQPLRDQIADRLHREVEPRRSGSILGFPSQLAALKTPIRETLTQIFADDARGARPLLRGVFLTSGRQDVLAIDAMLPALASRFGLSRAPALLPDLDQASDEHAWFIRRPLLDTVLGEAGLIARQRPNERRRAWIGRAAAAAAVLLCTVGAVRAADAQLDALKRVRAMGFATERLVLPPDLPSADPAALVAAYERLRRLSADAGAAISFDLFGVEPRLAQATAPAPARFARNALLPHLLARLQWRLLDHATPAAERAQLREAYRAIGQVAGADATAPRRWLNAELGRIAPEDQRAALRAELTDLLAPYLVTDGRASYDARIDAAGAP
jgi:type VI protein secretion system component VasK